MDRWEELESKLMSHSAFDPVVVRAKRILIAPARECYFDPHGRILVPPELRKMAGLEKDVVWIGQLDKIELWSSKEWEKAQNEAFQEDEHLPKALALLGL